MSERGHGVEQMRHVRQPGGSGGGEVGGRHRGVTSRNDDAGCDQSLDDIDGVREFGCERHQADDSRRNPGVDLVEQRLRFGGEARNVCPQMITRDHRPFEMQTERRRCPTASERVFGLLGECRHRSDRCRPGRCGSRHHGRQERRHSEARELDRDVEDAIRFGGDVDAVGAVALQVDESWRDQEVGTVDVAGVELADLVRVGDHVGDRVAIHHEVGADQFAADQDVTTVEASSDHPAAAFVVHPWIIA